MDHKEKNFLPAKLAKLANRLNKIYRAASLIEN